MLGMPFRFDAGPASSLVVNSLYLIRGGGRFRRPLPNVSVDRRSGSSTGAVKVKRELSSVHSGQHAGETNLERYVKTHGFSSGPQVLVPFHWK